MGVHVPLPSEPIADYPLPILLVQIYFRDGADAGQRQRWQGAAISAAAPLLLVDGQVDGG
jgi:hypothetical protein